MRKITLLLMSVLFVFAVNAQKQQNVRSSLRPVVKKTIKTNNGSKNTNSVSYLNEGFESTSFPPTDWSLLSPDGGTGWERVTAGTTPIPGWTGGVVTVPANGGTACAYCTWSTGGASSNDQWLITPQLSNIQANDTIKFWARRAQIAYLDELQIKISTGAAAATSDFTVSGPVFTFPAGSGDSAWTQYVIPIGALVPVGSNVYVGFREVVADNTTDGASISIDKVTWGTLPATPIASVSPQAWAAGNVVLGNSVTSPAITLSNNGGGTLTVSAISGLSAPYTTTLVPASVSLATDQSTTFTFTFAPTTAAAANQTVTLTTNAGDVTIALTGTGVECTALNIPFNEGFETENACATIIDANSDTFTWHYLENAAWAHGGTKFARYSYNTDGATGGDDYFVLPGINFTAGTNYNINFWHKVFDGLYPESFQVKMGTTANAGGLTTVLVDKPGQADTAWNNESVNFTVPTTGVYYIAFYCNSNADQWRLAIDDVTIDLNNGVAENSQEVISVFPNPANDRLYIDAKNVNTVEIFNLTGARVASYGNQNTINISDLAQGTYLVKVITDNKVTTQKINIVR